VKVIVLGAGIIGVSTAYYLARAGHRVTVLDRQPEPALETSFANGGQISASHAEPWANPATPFKLLGWLGRKDAPLWFRFGADGAMWDFFLRFLANCRGGASRANAAKALRLALHSRAVMAALRQETNIAFDAEDRGILHIYRSSRALERAAATAERFRAFGLATEVLNPDACVGIEPALAPMRDSLAGAIYSPDDFSGDAHIFTRELARRAAEAGAEFNMNSKVLRLAHMGDRVTGVMTQRGMLTAERYVCALGSYSAPLLADIGIRLPLYPAKGYSATVPVTDDRRAPHVSLTDDDAKIVISRLGDHLRIAGTAEFNGFDTTINDARAGAVLAAGERLFPGCMDGARAEFWAGLRPLTPDGVPVIGRTRFTNLILNTGHGTLGWTMGVGSGHVVADLVTGRAPEIDLAGFGPERF
jgi:D-amino-acid dehydrogenase